MTQSTHADSFEPGQKVAVTQQIPRGGGVWTSRVVGEVVKFEQRKTGSWFAHAKGDRLWLDRLTLRKEDGEIVECILDANTRVDHLGEAKATGKPSAPQGVEAAGEATSDDQASGSAA